MKKFKYEKGQAYPLGAHITEDGITFSTVLPENAQVKLVLYKKNYKNPCFEIEFDEQLRYGNIGTVHICGIVPEKYEYCYEIDGKNVADEYAVSLIGNEKFGTVNDFSGMRCGFLTDFDWGKSKRPAIPMGEVVLYRLHVRGFTKHNSSNIKYKGTFAGVVEKIPYLLNLGVNQIELMPVYEFADAIEVKQKFEEISPDAGLQYKCNYWGYAKINRYFAVKRAYSYDSNSSDEFKQMIKTMHENGIEVILQFYFEKNTKIQLIVDCLRFWLLEYRVDGFRIMGDSDYSNLLQNEPVFSDIKLYFQYVERNKSDFSTNIAITNEQYKQAVRAFLKSDMGRSEETAYLLRRNRSDDNINYIDYVCCHDGFTMYDMVSYENKHNELNEEDNLDGADYNFSWNCGVEGKTKKKKILDLRYRQMKNAWFMLLFSRGIPAILAGDELCNSQNGNNNAYCQDNAIGWVNWNMPKKFANMPEYVRKLILIRKNYNSIWNEKTEKFLSNEESFPIVSYHGEKAWDMKFRMSDRYFGVMYTSTGSKEQEIIYIAYNMNWMPRQFALPKLKKGMNWYILTDTSADETSETERKITLQKITVEERSCVLLAAK